MIEQDTIRLLRECDAGVRMGMDSIREVMPHVRSEAMKTCLNDCQQEHRELDREIRAGLHRFGDEGKSPSLMASAMSKFKTEMSLAMKDSDATVAKLMTEGCNMGVESLNRYLNQYKAADEDAKDIAQRLINREQLLAFQLRPFL